MSSVQGKSPPVQVKEAYLSIYLSTNTATHHGNLDMVTCRQGTKIFQYCTRPAGRVTYNFHSSCKHMHSSLKIVCNKENGGGGGGGGGGG